MKRVFALCLALSLLLLCGCAPEETPATVPSAEQTQPSTQVTVPSTAPTEATVPTTGATEPAAPMLYQNPLTGEPMAEQVLARPFAVVLNNSKGAMPQHGVGAADILYEALIEGETRCLGIFFNMNPETAATLGTIRSARYYFVQIAQGYNAIYVHNGASSEAEIGAEEYFEKTGWPHLDAIRSKGAHKYYYRDRQDTYEYEHTLFIKPEGVTKLAQELKYTTQLEEMLDVGLHFDDDKVIVGNSGKDVTIWFNFSGKPSPKWHKGTAFTYNAQDKLYYASQHHPDGVHATTQWADYADGNTGEQIAFRNVLVLRTAVSEKKGSVLLYTDTVGSGTGYFISNGQSVEINWSRKTVNDPFTYTLAANGQPVTFGVGHTYIAVVPNKAQVEIG